MRRRSLLATAAAAATAGLLPVPGRTARAAAAPLTAPTVARLGDSIIQYAEYASVANATTGEINRLYRRARGAMTWVKLLFPAFNDDVWHYPADTRQNRFMRGSNNGLAGDHTEYLTAANPGTLRRWTDEVAPMDPDLVMLSVGTNNINSFQLAGQLEADLQTHADTIAAPVVLATIRPRSPAGRYAWGQPDDPRYAVRRAVNDWIRPRIQPGLTTTDVNEYLEDPASRGGAGGDWLPGMTLPDDGVHPLAHAGWAEALTLLPVFRSLIAAGNVYGDDPTAPGNLLPGAFTGTGGVVGTGVTGVCATGWAVLRAAGDATAVSSVVSEGGVNRLVLSITPSTQDSTFYLQTNPANISLSGVPAGSWLRLHLRQSVTAYAGWKVYNPRLFLRNAANAYTFQATALDPYSGELMPASAWTGWPATHPVQTTAADTTAQCSVQVAVAGGVPGTPVISFANAQLRQVADPRPAWNS